MTLENFMLYLPTPLKWMVVIFTIVLTIGFFTGISFVNFTTHSTPKGVLENYNGNETDDNASEMLFKKSKREIYNIIHTHILSLSTLFFITGFLVYGTPINKRLKSFLCCEPFISLLLTFGGIYLLWLDIHEFVYVVIFSGILMTLSYIFQVVIILKYTLLPNKQKISN